MRIIRNQSSNNYKQDILKDTPKFSCKVKNMAHYDGYDISWAKFGRFIIQ